MLNHHSALYWIIKILFKFYLLDLSSEDHLSHIFKMANKALGFIYQISMNRPLCSNTLYILHHHCQASYGVCLHNLGPVSTWGNKGAELAVSSDFFESNSTIFMKSPFFSCFQPLTSCLWRPDKSSSIWVSSSNSSVV